TSPCRTAVSRYPALWSPDLPRCPKAPRLPNLPHAGIVTCDNRDFIDSRTTGFCFYGRHHADYPEHCPACLCAPPPPRSHLFRYSARRAPTPDRTLRYLLGCP